MVVAGSPSGERQPRRRRWAFRLALGGTLLGVLFALAYGFRGAWLAPLLVRRLQAEARERFGAELTVEHVSGSWFEDLTLAGVRWRAERPPLERLEEGRIEVRYSLAKLLRGEKDWLQSVAARARDVELVLESSKGSAQATLSLPVLDLDLAQVLVRAPGFDPLRLERVQAQARLTPERIEITSFEARAGGNRLGARAASLELDAPSLQAFVQRASGEFTLALSDAEAFRWARARPVPVRSADLTLSARRGHASVAGRIELEGGSLSIGRGALTLDEGAPLEGLLLDLGLTAEFRDLAPVGKLVGHELTGEWSGAVDVSGPLRALVGRFHGSGRSIRVAELALDAVEIELETDGERARIQSCHASGPAFEADVRGELRLQPLELVDAALDVHATSPALARVFPFPCDEASLHARLSGAPSALSGEFEASMTGVELGRLRMDDAEARGKVAGNALDIDELRLSSGESYVQASGRLRRADDGFLADLSALSLDWQGARGELERSATVSFGPGRFAVDGLALRSEKSSASDEFSPGRATISLRHEHGATHGSLEFADYDAGPLLAPWLPAGWKAGTVHGRLAGELGTDVPDIDMDLALGHWSVGPDRSQLSLRMSGGYAAGRLALETLRASLDDEDSSSLTGSLAVPLDLERPLEWLQGEVALRLELETQDAVQSLLRLGIDAPLASTGPCRLRADLDGSWEALAGTVRLEAEALTVGTGKEARACDLAADLEFGERVRLESLVCSTPGSRITVTGDMELAADVPRLLRDRRALFRAPLALDAALELGDIGWVAKVLPDVRRISGSVAGHVAVTGTLIAPGLDGTLAWRAGELRHASLSTPLRNLTADVSFDGDVVHVESLAGEYGGAPVTVKGTIEPFGPFPRLDLELASKNLLLKRSSRLRLRADAALVVKGTPSQLHIGGELALTEGRYTGEIDPLKEILHVGQGADEHATDFAFWRTGPLARAGLDIHIGGAHTFEYETNLLESSLRLDAWLRGTGAQPTAEGPVYIESASLTLPSGKLELTSGLLMFRKEAPFRPEAELRCELRVQGYDVRFTATGPFDRHLKPELSSTPPLAYDDLWILVLTGQPPTDRWGDRSQQAMESLALFLARDRVVRWLSGDSSSSSLFERIEIDMGAKTSDSGQPTGRVLFYLRPKTARSGRATYLSAEIDEHDRVNYALGIVFRPR